MLRHRHQRQGAVFMGAGLFALIVILLVLISIPVVHNTRARNRAKVCVENLNQLVAAQERYALDHDLKEGATIGMQDLIKDGQVIKQAPICPGGGKYSLHGREVFPTCSLGGDHVLKVPKKIQ